MLEYRAEPIGPLGFRPARKLARPTEGALVQFAMVSGVRPWKPIHTPMPVGMMWMSSSSSTAGRMSP